MPAPKTTIILLLSISLLVGTGLLMRPVVVLRPVRLQTGELMHRADGRSLMEKDTLGQFRANWDAYCCMFDGFILFGWALARGCRGWYARGWKHNPQQSGVIVRR